MPAKKYPWMIRLQLRWYISVFKQSQDKWKPNITMIEGRLYSPNIYRAKFPLYLNISCFSTVSITIEAIRHVLISIIEMPPKDSPWIWANYNS